MMRKILLLLLVSMCIFSQEEFPVGEFPKIIAKNHERIKDTYIAWGDVEIAFRDVKIFADRIEFDSKNIILKAEGNVVLELTNQSISAEKIIMNLEEETGEMWNIFGIIEPGLFFSAKHSKKTDEDMYLFKKASFTPCLQPNPRWKISTSGGKIKRESYVDMWNATFWLKGFPVFYIPYIRYPLPKEGRKSGFLIPQVGHSSIKGTILNQSFFLAFGRSADVTFNYDIYSKKGNGQGAEIRWILNHGNYGNIKLYNFFYKKDQILNTKRDYLIIGEARHKLFWDIYARASVNYQSAVNFLQNFENNFNLITIGILNSIFYLSKTYKNYSFYLRADKSETFFLGSDYSFAGYRLPEFQFYKTKSRVFSLPLYFSLNSSFGRLKRKIPNDEPLLLNRFIFNPSFSLSLAPFPWISISPQFNLNNSIYFKSYGIEKGKMLLTDDPIHIKIPQFRIEIVGPIFNRIFNTPNFSFSSKFKHIIEPRIVYDKTFQFEEMSKILYRIPEVDFSESWFYSYYFHYAIPNQISFMLTNRILAKRNLGGEQLTPVEIFSLSLYQYRYLEMKTKEPLKPNWGSYIRFSPTQYYNAHFRLNYDYFRKVKDISLGVGFNSPSKNADLNISWSVSNIITEQKLERVFNQLRIYTHLKIPYTPIDFTGEVDYDFVLKIRQFTSLKLGFDYQCLNFSFQYLSIDLTRYINRREHQIRFNIGLANLGLAQDLLGGRGF